MEALVEVSCCCTQSRHTLLPAFNAVHSLGTSSSKKRAQSSRNPISNESFPEARLLAPRQSGVSGFAPEERAGVIPIIWHIPVSQQPQINLQSDETTKPCANAGESRQIVAPAPMAARQLRSRDHLYRKSCKDPRLDGRPESQQATLQPPSTDLRRSASSPDALQLTDGYIAACSNPSVNLFFAMFRTTDL
jgi:hypothetical protein